jgi:hypothetical protein
MIGVKLMPVDPNEKKLLGAQVPIEMYNKFAEIAEEENRTIAAQLTRVVKEFIIDYKNKNKIDK